MQHALQEAGLDGLAASAPTAPEPTAPAARAGTAPPFEVRAGTLESLAAHWPRTDRMGEARCHVFQCADVLEVWQDTIGRALGVRARFVGVFDRAGEPVMLLALGVERRRGVRVLTFLDGTVSDYNGPVLFPASRAIDDLAWPDLWAAIRAALPAFDVALLDKMPPEIGGLPNPILRLATARMAESGHVMSLGGTRDSLERRLPQTKRQTRYHKQLVKIGPVTLRVAEERSRAEAFLADMVENKTRKFAETRVPGFELPGKLAFYREATRRLSLPDPVHVAALTVGDTVIASHWGLVLGDRFYYLMTAYAGGEWRRYGPGRFLTDDLIRWCHARGFAWYDFGIGDEAYKDDYCDVTIPLHRADLAATPLGRLHLRAAAGLEALRATRLWRLVRPWKWVVLRALKGGRAPAAEDAPQDGKG